MKLAIDANHRCQSTGADTSDDFKTEFAVTSGLARLDLQLSLDGVEDRGRSLHVAGRASAHLDVISPLRLESELIVKCRNTVYFAGGQP